MINDKLKTELYYFLIFVMLIALLGAIWTGYVKEIDVTDIGASEKIIVIEGNPEPTPSLKPSPAPEEKALLGRSETDGQERAIDDLISEVFGQHSDKAMLLLKGSGKKERICAYGENWDLDPKAVNRNKDGSRDLGVFQINTYWNGFRQNERNEDFLFDPEINVRMAWRLYEDSGYSFKLWTCGKYYGI